MTPEGGAVLEIRSKDIFFNPGAVDVTLGGLVNTGEEPERAALRELKEELGISLEIGSLHLLGRQQRSAWHPRHRKLSRSIVYVYLGVIDPEDIVFRPEFSEVAGIALCTPKQLRDLLHGKRVKDVGRITSSQAYYNGVVRQARHKLKELVPSRRTSKKTVQ
jgi:ADP-ribose pyrophosphatase YjhB (NUDIX family)